MITTPAWVTLGASFPVAVAADKVAGTFWTVVAARTYLARGRLDRQLLLGMGIAGLLGAASGALLATALDESLLRRGGRNPDSGRNPAVAPAPGLLPCAGGVGGRSRGAAAWGFPLGVYEGVLGSGNAILTTLLLQRTRGWDLLVALGHYYALAAMWCALAAVMYLWRGAFDPALTLAATLGSVGGGALGSRLGTDPRVVRGPAPVHWGPALSSPSDCCSLSSDDELSPLRRQRLHRPADRARKRSEEDWSSPSPGAIARRSPALGAELSVPYRVGGLESPDEVGSAARGPRRGPALCRSLCPDLRGDRIRLSSPRDPLPGYHRRGRRFSRRWRPAMRKRDSGTSCSCLAWASMWFPPIAWRCT